MTRPIKLWVALGLFSAFLGAFVGFWLWAEFGFESTVIIYETAEGRAVQSKASAEVDTAEAGTAEGEFIAAPALPSWVLPARWGSMSAAAAAVIYIAYLEAVHRRGQRGLLREIQQNTE